jgi:hypothetical protein
MTTTLTFIIEAIDDDLASTKLASRHLPSISADAAAADGMAAIQTAISMLIRCKVDTLN